MIKVAPSILSDFAIWQTKSKIETAGQTGHIDVMDGALYRTLAPVVKKIRDHRSLLTSPDGQQSEQYRRFC